MIRREQLSPDANLFINHSFYKSCSMDLRHGTPLYCLSRNLKIPFCCLKWTLCTRKSSYVECMNPLNIFPIFYLLRRADLIVLRKLVKGVLHRDLNLSFATSHIILGLIEETEIKKNNKKFENDELFLYRLQCAAKFLLKKKQYKTTILKRG